MHLNSKNIEEEFRNRFDSEPVVVESPARVNLIGEHTDYNDGFVLPAAIDKKIILAMAPNGLNSIRMFAVDMDHPYFEAKFPGPFQKSGRGWPDYILGVVDQLEKRSFSIGGFDCLFGGDIPIGAGLSSSAALEGGILTGLNELFSLDLSTLEMAKVGQQAENQFVGVQCGIMDQFANLHGMENSVIRLDCRSLEYSHYPFKREDICILLCDTKIRRELASSEYNVRRQQCEEGASILREFDPSIRNLRDVSHSLLENYRDKLSGVVYNRCRYVLDENQRVLDACNHLLADEIEPFGELMYRSHEGLRDLYEVSCRELDLLVESTIELDEVYGSRMMGGGFGGCTINLVDEHALDRVKEHIRKEYKKKVETTVEFYVAKIGEGAALIGKKQMG
ncbi:galactokinase [Rhodohalobacter sp. SW132]|uniref:galactokinase n=1 Tax=Rhodohalobacter sp. SW132 TaxID=2293433 RepID=UPI000E2729C0|nr:galactokinase [Rhodohalobacter sp. SW132]REL33047.1 galactokinase [Rhodohalobacter sp. SW132]